MSNTSGKKNTAVMIVGISMVAGCVSIHPEVDQHYGQAVATARFAQTFNPQASRNPNAVAGMDGKAAKETMDRYLDTFKAPPPTINVINIGGALGGR